MFVLKVFLHSEVEYDDLTWHDKHSVIKDS